MLTCGGIGVLRFEKFGAHRYRFEKLELNDFEFWKKKTMWSNITRTPTSNNSHFTLVFAISIGNR